ncbi:undecaprenyl-diphosphate phosphatase [Velocimicrobium porci]|uniref:Undecaprenyl-diphosphatase n=1 Tax=Velocimicrobium porci TaxID=2606634 RepID=A0A6L5XX70_9FIRM|nr:undecaprenyl-diphosphate phosphatase [Velocimicrobium porci]MSS63342.1 undecaprenyl-diphosphate phosphatase [Velocimicrobium porci]
MKLWEAIVMGIVQGLAEFLPISSSGHLALFKNILGIDLEAAGGLLFDVMLHFGTLVAIFVVFWKDIKKLIIEGFSIIGDFFINVGRFFSNRIGQAGKNEPKEYKKVIDGAYRKFVMMVIVSTIPTGIIGVLLDNFIEKASESVIIPGVGLIITAILLTIADHAELGKKRPNQISYTEAGIVGIAQGIATMPGISRSGTTITTCLKLGFDKNFAVKYSFIMSIPAVLGAVVLKLKDFASITFETATIVNYTIGTIVSAVVGYICIKTMLVIVRGKKFKGFAFYCFIVGAIAIIWNFVG